jgi:hypothetical protein
MTFENLGGMCAGCSKYFILHNIAGIWTQDLITEKAEKLHIIQFEKHQVCPHCEGEIVGTKIFCPAQQNVDQFLLSKPFSEN